LLGEFVDFGDGVDFECVGEVVWGEVGVGVVGDGFYEVLEVGFVAGESGGHVVASEGFEVGCGGFESFVDGVAVDGAG